jgi:hypothetical protein
MTSTKAFAASGFRAVARIATGSVKQDAPSTGSANSTGAPLTFSRIGRKSTIMP